MLVPCAPRTSVSTCRLHGGPKTSSLRPIRHPLHVPALAHRAARALTRCREWLVVPGPDSLECQHTASTAADAPQPDALHTKRPQVSHSRRFGGLRGFRRPQDTRAMTQRDYPPRPRLRGGLVGSDGHGGVLHDRQGLVDLVAIPDLDLERVFNLAAHLARGSPFVFCSQPPYLGFRANARPACAEVTAACGYRALQDWKGLSISKSRAGLSPQRANRYGKRLRQNERRRGHVDRHAMFITCRSGLTPSSGHVGMATAHRTAPTFDSWQHRICVLSLVPVAECRNFEAPFDGLFHSIAAGLPLEEASPSECSSETATLCGWPNVTRFTWTKLLGFKRIRARNDHQSR